MLRGHKTSACDINEKGKIPMKTLSIFRNAWVDQMCEGRYCANSVR